MSGPLKIKQDDTGRVITDTLVLGGAAIDLTEASVVLVWAQPDGTVNRRTATVVSPTAGTVSYAPVAGDVSEAGRHRLEWEITFASGKELTVPSEGAIHLIIAEDLG